jgi:hypothetical protein
MIARFAIFVALLAPVVLSRAGECTAKSGGATAALVELYTSEGCNSCPPADAWLGRLPRTGFGPDRMVPLALHVDYWDYIGWKDPFANRAFSGRQREIAAINNARAVYTPQVILAGRDYRGWPSVRSFADAVKSINARPARADISLTLRQPQSGRFELRAAATVPQGEGRRDAALYVAAYENGLSHHVTAGENRGVTLHHDFVVRDWWGPIAFDAYGTADVTRPISGGGVAKGGVAAFVQSRRTGEVLQALALPSCDAVP